MEKIKSIIIGGGCFWCTEAMFKRLNGIISAENGYSGGHMLNPTYEQVCSGTTGHAEVIKIEYDCERISLHEIIDIHFKTHDPTTMNRQGADTGTQYRSIIFYNNEDEKQIIQNCLKESQVNFDKPIVTEVKPVSEFYKAEDYHQNYFRNNPEQSYCNAVISPKIKKFEIKFAEKLK